MMSFSTEETTKNDGSCSDKGPNQEESIRGADRNAVFLESGSRA